MEKPDYVQGLKASVLWTYQSYLPPSAQICVGARKFLPPSQSLAMIKTQHSVSWKAAWIPGAQPALSRSPLYDYKHPLNFSWYVGYRQPQINAP